MTVTKVPVTDKLLTYHHPLLSVMTASSSTLR